MSDTLLPTSPPPHQADHPRRGTIARAVPAGRIAVLDRSPANETARLDELPGERDGVPLGRRVNV